MRCRRSSGDCGERWNGRNRLSFWKKIMLKHIIAVAASLLLLAISWGVTADTNYEPWMVSISVFLTLAVEYAMFAALLGGITMTLRHIFEQPQGEARALTQTEFEEQVRTGALKPHPICRCRHPVNAHVNGEGKCMFAELEAAHGGPRPPACPCAGVDLRSGR